MNVWRTLVLFKKPMGNYLISIFLILQEIEQVGKLIKINKAHSGLVQTRIVGPWMVHYCLNCGVNSHAVHQQRGAAYVLVATRLLVSFSTNRVPYTFISSLYVIVHVS